MKGWELHGLMRRRFLHGAGAVAATSLLGGGCGDDAAAHGTGGGTTSAGATTATGTGTSTASGATTTTSTAVGQGGGPSGTGGAGGAPGVGGGGGAGGGTLACEKTEDDIEGPFHAEGAPVVDGVLTGADDLPGVLLVLRGRVHTALSCAALAGATLDIWQADDDGADDNLGFTLRGKVETLPDGSYEVRTIIPGHYLNGNQFRPAHIHVKASAAGHTLLTTQLYFPDDPYNEMDPWFDERLLIDVVDIKGALTGTFDFFLVPA